MAGAHDIWELLYFWDLCQYLTPGEGVNGGVDEQR